VTESIKLNLGSGDKPIDGWSNIDIKTGGVIFPLPNADNSVDEIRASHVLEHFPHGKVFSVLKDWVRALKPNGKLRIAVPNLQIIAEAYLSGKPWPIQGFLMGGQTDAHDFHYSVFDPEMLEEALRAAGLGAIHPWTSEIEDCASLPVSLNVAGYKKPQQWPATQAVMSVPRLGFMDNFFCSYAALAPLQIQMRKFSGAFWGQCLTRAIQEALGDQPEYILTLDYDTIYQKRDVEDLLLLASAHPDIDAIAPLQQSRFRDSAMFVIENKDGTICSQMKRDDLKAELVRVKTAHFGCTLLRSLRVAEMSRPWFHSMPDKDGGWDDGRIDDDVYFWYKWEKEQRTLALAPHVVVGHAELMIRWPDEALQPLHQLCTDFWKKGPPSDAWK